MSSSVVGGVLDEKPSIYLLGFQILSLSGRRRAYWEIWPERALIGIPRERSGSPFSFSASVPGSQCKRIGTVAEAPIVVAGMGRPHAFIFGPA
jgi:hypothetical protein